MNDREGEWAFSGPALDELKELLSSGLAITFDARYSDEWGGDYWATPNRAVPCVVVYPNAEDEEGPIFINRHPEVTALVAAIDLTDEQFQLIQSLGGRPIEEYQQPSL